MRLRRSELWAASTIRVASRRPMYAAEGPVRQSPEEQHLADQERLLADLTEQLATKEAEFATVNAQFDRFRTSYLARFAPLYAELDRLEAEIARL